MAAADLNITESMNESGAWVTALSLSLPAGRAGNRIANLAQPRARRSLRDDKQNLVFPIQLCVGDSVTG